MEIIKLKPTFKQYIWGGDGIHRIFGKDTPAPPVAESWEISAHPDGMSTVCGGKYDGMTIPELCEKYGTEFYGNSMKQDDEFPLLLKILDAADRLSVQVHPDDAYAYKHENKSKGKTEAWYILNAEDDAKLIYGFKKDITKEDFKNAIENECLEDILNAVPCKAGDVFYIPSGTVHAVGKGMMIAEIQQSSNTTYRVYDYNRRDKDGNLRELHIDKAIEVSQLASAVGKEKVTGDIIKAGNNIIKKLINNDFFCFDEITIVENLEITTDNLLHMVLVAKGDLVINGTKLKMGDSALIPASVGEYTISGNGTLLRYYKK